MAIKVEGEIRFADLKGPRFNIRKFRRKIVSKELYRQWKKSNPGITLAQFTRIWKLIAKEMQEVIVEESDGILLPNGIGEMYLGYVKLKRIGTDYKTSKEHNVLVNYENFHSYGKTGKIIFRACTKYKLSTCSLWNFRAITPFKEKVTKAFNEQPEIYKNSRQKQYHGHPNNRTSDLSANESG